MPREGAGAAGGLQGVRQPPEHRVVAAARAQRAPRLRRLRPCGPPGEGCIPATFSRCAQCVCRIVKCCIGIVEL